MTDKKLTQDEIDKLLASTKPQGKKKNVVLEKFLANGKKFNKQIAEWLVFNLLKDEKKGHGLWWGGESCLSFVGLTSYEAKEVEGGYELSAVCKMEYQSSHIIYDENYEPMLQDSRIKLTLSPDLEIKGFDSK